MFCLDMLNLPKFSGMKESSLDLVTYMSLRKHMHRACCLVDPVHNQLSSDCGA